MANSLSPILITFFVGMFLLGCAKVSDQQTHPTGGGSNDSSSRSGDTSSRTTQDTSHIHYALSIKVLEYQTNIPISSALYTRIDCSDVSDTGCTVGRIAGNWFADSNGNILIKGSDTIGNPKTGETKLEEIIKDNYWTRSTFDSLAGNDSIKYAVVRLYPFAWLKIHLKNEIYRAQDVKMTMHFGVNAPSPDFPYPFNTFTKYGYFSSGGNSLDTVFLIRTYAYVGNEVQIDQDSTDALGNPFQYVWYEATKQVDKFDTLDWEIIIKN